MADDLGAVYTDKRLRSIERSLRRVYSQAQKDIEKKTADFFAQAEREEEAMLKKVSGGSITQEAFDDWKRKSVFTGKNWQAQQENIAKVLSDTNGAVNSLLRGEQIKAFAFNANYTAYQFEHGFGVNFGFDIYNQDAVTRLLKDNPNILPFKKLDKRKDERWNFKNIRSQIAQGIIQGESIPKIAKRLSEVVPNRNEQQMIRHARTAMTSAQNGARQERFREAEELGIKFKKVWLATLDNRTREAHAELDGQAVKPDDDFEVDGYKIAFPGDPHADPSLTYNCRCTMVTELDDYPSSFTRRVQEDGEIIEDQSYQEWFDSKTENENIVRIQYDSSLGSTPKSNVLENLKNLGYTEDDVEEVRKLFNLHTDGGAKQEEADDELLEHLNKHDKIGNLLSDKSVLEEQAWEKGIEKEKRFAHNEYERKVESAKEGLLPGGLYENYTEQDLKDWGIWPEDEHYVEPRFYRKGNMDKGILSFTTNERGAGMSYLTDEEDGYIGWDVSYTLSEMINMGYHPIAGIMSMDVGQVGESEVLFAKFKRKKHGKRNKG